VGNLKPLLKWAGGKRWLLPLLTEIWQPYTDAKLVEPFTGGMAVALGLNPKTALLNDANEHLINFYHQVRNGLEIKKPLLNESDFYYETRDQFNQLIAKNKHLSKAAAIMFYYLIRTGFNGLCRFNSDGGFNVPFGQHSSINYKINFSEYQRLFNTWELTHGDFGTIELSGAEFVYADPPYDVEFTRYNAQDFVWDDQVRLAAWLAQHDGPVVASNQATKRIQELYKDLKFKVFLLPAPRMISCNGDRSPAIEILAVRNVTRSVIAKLQSALKR
jgi:DNA adenine methylase